MSGDNHHAHLQSFKLYFGILMALLVLTIITVWVSTFDFGKWNDVIAIGVAGTKASLVILFFMHGRFESKLIWAFIYFPLIILSTLIAALFLDYGNRNPEDYLVGTVKVAPKDHHGDDHGDANHGAGDHKEDAQHDAAPNESSSSDHSEQDADPSDEQDADHSEATPSDEPPANDATPSDTTAAITDQASEEQAASKPWTGITGDAEAGKTHAKAICIACHIIDGVGNALPGAPPFEESANLDRIDPAYLRSWLKDPQKVKPGTLMPNFALSDGQVENLVAYLATYKK